VADAVVAEEVAAADHALDGRELLVADLHAAREHRPLRTGAGGRASVAREAQVGLGALRVNRHLRTSFVSPPFWTNATDCSTDCGGSSRDHRTSGTRGSGSRPAQAARVQWRAGSSADAIERRSPASAF